jgi:predicted RNA-binding protein YlxR (DUF448 family)
MTAHDPERRCILTGDRALQAMLVRLALGPDGQVAPDVRAKAPGRGAWIGVDRTAMETAIAKGKLKGALARAFKTSTITVPEELAALTEGALQRAALERLGLEARASMLLTGSDRIAEAARSGRVVLLLHAGDAADDGCRKLDQAWRVGCESEGSGQTGVKLAATRDELSAALGRDNVVHIAITDARAAARVGQIVGRWHHFIGHPAAAALADSPRQAQWGAAQGIDQTDQKDRKGIQ